MNNNLNFEPSYKELREKIQEHFSMGELKGLCFDIGLDFEDLSGDEKIEKTVQLIKYMQRREQLPELIQALYEKRQNVNWESCLGGGEDDIHYVKLISMRRTSDARKIHDTKHIASKIDMGGVQLTSFLKEIITDPKQEMIKRLFNEDVRVYAVFVHPDANCLIQRSIEDSDDLENLRESQRASVEMCL